MYKLGLRLQEQPLRAGVRYLALTLLSLSIPAPRECSPVPGQAQGSHRALPPLSQQQPLLSEP